MKGVVLTHYGDVEGLEFRELPEPTVGPDEVKVRLVATSINPIDWKLRSGSAQARMPLQLPAVLGRDAAGHVVAVGSSVPELSVGAPVIGLVMGSYAESVVAKATAWAPVPPELDLADAAAIPLVALTGSQLIDEAVGVRPGDTVLVTGALGSVGRVAVFTARSRGAKVWVGVRRKQMDEARALDAEGIVALDDDGDLDWLPPLDAIADTIGGPTIGKLLAKVKKGGRIGSVVGDIPGARDLGLNVRPMMAHSDAKRLAEVAEAVALGRLILPIADRMPLTEIRNAQRTAERGAGGKIVVLI